MMQNEKLLKYHPLALFAAKHTHTEPRLIELCLVDKRYVSALGAKEAYEVFRSAADRGDVFAMCMCSRSLREGYGVTQSDEGCFLYAQRAAETGFAPGYFDLGYCYESGLGVDIDLKKAEHLYELSAQGKYGGAAWHLAGCYEKGKFGMVSVTKAVQFAEAAVEYGDLMAAYMLGNWYEQGEFIEKDESKAFYWYARGASMGDYFSSHRLFTAYSLGNLGLEKNQVEAKKYLALCDEQTKSLS